MSKELSKIRTDAPIGFDPDALRRQAPDVPRLVALFQELEFKALLDRLHKAGVVSLAGAAGARAAGGPNGAPGEAPETGAAAGAYGSVSAPSAAADPSGPASTSVTASAAPVPVLARTLEALQAEVAALRSAPPEEPLVIGLAEIGRASCSDR